MNLRQYPVPQTCIVVLGMHRSGTSALTGVLSLLGIHLGDSLLPAMENVNPKGFWEHEEVVSIHNQLLAAFDSSWYDETFLPNQWWLSHPATEFRDRIVSVLRRDFNNRPIWLIKDPRMCRLLPLWQEVFRELSCQPLFVLTLRNPTEIAHSLYKRDGLNEAASCLLWLTHMLEAEYQTRGLPRAFANYERLLSDWRGTVTNIGKTLSITWPASLKAATPDIEAFLDPALRHHVNDNTLPDHPVCRLAQEAFKLLSTPSPDPVELDRLRAQTGEIVNLVAPWSTQLRRRERQYHNLEMVTYQYRTTIAHRELENTSLHSEIKRIKNTVSWQITKPLRLLANIPRLVVAALHNNQSQTSKK